MNYPRNILEEELKNRLSHDFFSQFDCTKILGKIDYAVKLKRPAYAIDFADEYLLWAEAKKNSKDVVEMLTQLVLTIGKAKTFNEYLPPAFLGCFDSEKIAFIPYHEIQDIFYQNDFNWNVTSSNKDTREFKQVYEQIQKILDSDIPFQTYLFEFEKDEKELRRFIRENFVVGKADVTKLKIDKNNFINVYQKWHDTVKPTINVPWENVKKSGLIDGDFYLADLLSGENQTIPEKLNVLLKSHYYVANRHIDEFGLFAENQVTFSDNQKAYNMFWARYERPPHTDYWDYIIDRHDLLVPQDIRERKGSFYTPQIWVELSQQYLADALGKDWQDEYYIWDCCAGSGNLLAGLTNKYNIWASTLDKSDVDIMKQRIANGANLLESHVFQFDFLNDSFDKLPEGLKKIIYNENLREKLVIFINPPYAEATNYKGNTKPDVAKKNRTCEKYKNELDGAVNELFAQFFIRIVKEIPSVKMGAFSKVKYISAPNFKKFRTQFLGHFLRGFICPSSTFDNVTGCFPIGFLVFNLAEKKQISHISCDIYDKDNQRIGIKNFYSNINNKYLNEWITVYKSEGTNIGYLNCANNSFQNQKFVWISITEQNTHCAHLPVSIINLIKCCVYFAVRHCIPATWLNDRDQFLFPNKKWEKDIEFHNDCLVFTLFHGQNRISFRDGVNHWIPFTERQVAAKDVFESHFMSSFISGKVKQNGYINLFEQANKKDCIKREFSPAATAVFDAGRELWKYYHAQPDINVNASLYDIREHFQGRNEKGKMNSRSTDERYNELIANLRDALDALARKIEPKVYEYEFLLA